MLKLRYNVKKKKKKKKKSVWSVGRTLSFVVAIHVVFIAC